ncbi:MAG: DVU_1555 family C-GCAxxG-C-C protein, partial [Pseudomonadota bacterium]
ILMYLGLERLGRYNAELIRAMAGLASGCGIGQASCGVLTGAACVLGLYAGGEGGGKKESQLLLPMLAELNQWFAVASGGVDGAVTCQAILEAPSAQAPPWKCAELVARAFVKTMELLSSHGFEPINPRLDDDG